MRKLPTALSAAAVAVTLVGHTSIGRAAVQAIVPLAKFAQNTDKVDGIDASKTPKARQLIALGSDAKLPAAIRNGGDQGPPGDKGQAGSKGAKGDAGAKGAKGATGPKGAKGTVGAKGSAGLQGVAGLVEVTSSAFFSTTDDKTVQVQCPAGTKVLSGEFNATSASQVQVWDTEPFSNGTGWVVQASEISGTHPNWALVVGALCASVA